MAEKKYASLTNLQTFLNNIKNVFATKTSVEELSTNVAYINSTDNENITDVDSGSGLSDDEKTLLLNILSSAAFTNDDVGAAMGQLENLFAGNPAIEYTVTYNLTDVTADNEVSNVKAGFPFTVTLTAGEGLSIREDNLSVTMGGVDITNSVYVDGVISIPVVTGEIIITAESKNATLLYVLYEEAVFDGTEYLDTGISLFDENKPFSILVEFIGDTPYTNVFAESTLANGNEPYKNGYCLNHNGARWRIGVSYSIYTTQFINAAKKMVITYDNVEHKHTLYYLNDGVLTNVETSMNMASLVGTTAGLRLGTGYSYNQAGFKGTIYSFEVYSKVVDKSKINTFMGVE